MLKEELEKRRWLDAQKSALQEKLRKIEAGNEEPALNSQTATDIP